MAKERVNIGDEMIQENAQKALLQCASCMMILNADGLEMLFAYGDKGMRIVAKIEEVCDIKEDD